MYITVIGRGGLTNAVANKLMSDHTIVTVQYPSPDVLQRSDSVVYIGDNHEDIYNDGIESFRTLATAIALMKKHLIFVMYQDNEVRNLIKKWQLEMIKQLKINYTVVNSNTPTEISTRIHRIMQVNKSINKVKKMLSEQK